MLGSTGSRCEKNLPVGPTLDGLFVKRGKLLMRLTRFNAHRGFGAASPDLLPME
jgi:hypothetical protein